MSFYSIVKRLIVSQIIISEDNESIIALINLKKEYFHKILGLSKTLSEEYYKYKIELGKINQNIFRKI